MVGRNTLNDGYEAWVHLQLVHGKQHDPSTTKIVWLTTAESPNRLSCQVKTPLDDGTSLKALYSATKVFIPDNSLPCLATMACCVMVANYQLVITQCGHIGVPLLFGSHGSCNTEAVRGGLALFGAQSIHAPCQQPDNAVFPL